MKTLHRLLLLHLRDHAEALALIESALDATVECEFDLVEHLVSKLADLTLSEAELNHLLETIKNAKDK